MIRIQLDNITKTYGSGRKKTEVLKAINAVIEPGEFFFLLGPSGCGKTTLLRIISGLIDPTGGTIQFNDEDVTNLEVEKRDCAMVFQNYALWPHMTVQQNVEFGPRMQGKNSSQRKELSQEKLSLVQMEEYTKRKPNQLSGGQQQRVALARALAAQTGCLLLDEPLSNLDARLRMQMRGELRELVKETGVTAIYVTHDQKEALSMADRIAIMHSGEIIQVGSPSDIYNNPATKFVADFVGEANFAEGKVTAKGEYFEVNTPMGKVLGRTAGEIGTGDTVTCCIRPERLEIERTGPKRDTNRFSGTIERITYLGEISQLHVRLPGEILWKITAILRDQKEFSIGDTITLCGNYSDMIFLDR